MIEIKRLGGTTILSFDEVPEGALVHRELMADHYVKLPFSLAEPVYLRIGDYVDTDFGRFELTKQYKPKYNTSTSGYDYTLQLDAYYIKWKNKKVRYMPEYGAKEVTFKLTANIDTHLNVVLRTINALGAKDSNFRYNGQPYVVQFLNFPESKRTTAKYYLYDKTDIISALDGLAKLYECEWWVEDNIIFFGKCEIGSDIIEFNIDVNVDEMSHSEADTIYATRLYAFGSTRNLPHNYEDVGADVTVDGVVQKRLPLPDSLCPNGYLQDAQVMNETEAIEGVLVNDDIYPKVECVVGEVITYDSEVEEEDGTTTTQTFYRLKDSSGFQFSEDMILEGESLHILFQSGSMNGMDFECRYDNEGKYYEVIANEDYGRLLPDATLHPVVGMKFVLYNWDATKIEATGIIDTAKKELYDYTLDYLNESKIDPSTYDCTLKSVWVYNDGLHFRNFDMGARVNLINDAFFEESRTSRIIGFEIKLDKPYDTPKYIVGEKAAYSRRKDMERQIEAVTVNGNAYSVGNSSGIGGGGTSIYVIKRYDGAIPSDYNVFSAKRSMDEFLSRKQDDTASGIITFLKGLISKGNVVVNGLLTAYNAVMNSIKSSNYTGDGVADSGWSITNDYAGSSRLVVDYLYARKKAVYESLEVKELRFTSGDLAQSLASAMLERTDYLEVDEQGNETLLGYSVAASKRIRITLKPEDLLRVNRIRCYFLAKDDDKEIHNLWRENDLARCQTFNIDNIDRETYAGDTHKEGNVYWWRLVKGYSTEAVTLDGKEYHYFDVAYGYTEEQEANSTGVRTSWCDLLSDLPAAGDKVVHFGNTSDPARMNIIVSEVNGEGNIDAPAIKSYRGVHTFNTDDDWWGGESCRKMMLSPSSGVEFYAPSFKFITEYGIERTQVERGAWLSIPFEEDTEHQTFPDYSDDILDENGNFVSRSNGSPKKYVRKCRYYDNVEHRGSSWRCTIAESHYWRYYDVNGKTWSKITEAQYKALSSDDKARCEEVRNYTTDEPSKSSNDWTVSAERGQDGGFKSRVFCRTNTNIKNANVSGGSYDNPIPTLTKIGDSVVAIEWTDGIPQGTEILWSTVCTFHADGSSSGWSKPAPETDTSTQDIEFSPRETQPAAPTGDTPFADHSSEGWYDPSNLPEGETMIWRAERAVRNGVYDGEWVVTRIYGEKGDAGTSPWVADLDNEMDSVACYADGHPTSEQTVMTGVSLLYGGERRAATVAVYKDRACEQPYTNSDELENGLAVYWTIGACSNHTVSVKVDSALTISGSMNFYVKITDGESGVFRLLVFTVNGIRPGDDGQPATIYNLLPSEKQVSVGRNTDGTYNPATFSLTCGYTKNVGGVMTTVPNVTEQIDGKYCLYYRLRNRSDQTWGSYRRYDTVFQPLSGVSVASYDQVEFVLSTEDAMIVATMDANTVIDRETVPVVADGKQGEQGNNGDDAVTVRFSRNPVVFQGNSLGQSVNTTVVLVYPVVYVGGTPVDTTPVSIKSKPSGLNVVIRNVAAEWDGVSTQPVAISPTDIGVAEGALTGIVELTIGYGDNKTITGSVVTTVAHSGTSGNGVKEIFKVSDTQPDTPSGTDVLPVGWSEQPPVLTTGLTYSVTGDWTRNGNTLTSPATTADDGVYRSRVFFTTTGKATIVVRLTVSSEETYDIAAIAAADNNFLEGKTAGDIRDYSGTDLVANLSGDGTTGVFLLTVDAEGEHFFDVVYAKDSSTDDYNDNAVLELNLDTIWVSTSKIVTDASGNETAAGWSEPVRWNGPQGKMGRNFYYDGVYDSSKTYSVTDYEAPFVSYGANYYVRVGEGSCQGVTPSASSPYWELMTSTFKYLITAAIFSEYAKLGSWVFNDDYMFSLKDANGKDRGSQQYTGMGDAQKTSGFIPAVAMDAANGRASFSGDKVRFNPNGSGWVAGRNIKWDASGNAEFSGKVTATSGSIAGFQIKPNYLGATKEDGYTQGFVMTQERLTYYYDERYVSIGTNNNQAISVTGFSGATALYTDGGDVLHKLGANDSFTVGDSLNTGETVILSKFEARGNVAIGGSVITDSSMTDYLPTAANTRKGQLLLFSSGDWEINTSSTVWIYDEDGRVKQNGVPFERTGPFMLVCVGFNGSNVALWQYFNGR